MKKIILLCLVLLLSANVYAADTKISGLTVDATPGTDSLLHTIDDPGGTPANRKSTIAEVLTDGNIPNDLTITSTKAGTLDSLTLTTTALTVPNGGTGATTLTDGGLLLGSGVGVITALGAAANGQIPIGDGTTDPVLATITGTASEINVANGAGTITIGIVDPLAVAKGGTGASALTNLITLTTHTTGNYAAGDAEAGAALTGDTATAFFGAGTIEHERGGIEADISAIADGGVLVGTGAGSMGIRAAFLTAGAAGFVKHELGGLEAAVNAYSAILGINAGSTLEVNTSAEIVTLIDDETGSAAGSPLLVFNENPVLTGATLAGILADNDDMVFEIDANSDGSNKYSFTDGASVEQMSLTEAGLFTVKALTATEAVILGDGGDNFSIASDGIDIDTSGNITNAGTIASGVVTVTGVINTSVGLDAVGAVDLDYGSIDVTDHTFTTDSTGDAEIVLPNDSIGPAEIDSTTGAYDFGGVTSFEVPNGANPTTNAAGEIAVDSSAAPGSGVRFFGDAAYTLAGTYTRSFIISNPTASADNSLWKVPYNITITQVSLLCKGNVTVGHLTEQDANGLNDAGVDGATDITGVVNTNVNDDGTLSNPSIDANDYLGWRTTSVTSTPTYAIITFTFTIDQVN